MTDQNKPQFTIHQMHAANRLGVSEEWVREKRARLEEGTDWVKRGTRILYSNGGVEKLAAILALPKPPKTPLMLPWPAIHELVVAKIWSNPGYVGAVRQVLTGPIGKDANGLGVGFAAIPEDGALLRVRVKTSANLSRGMVLKCVHIAGDLYECRNLPRRKGRW
jgi:hypothetical protein